MEYSGWAYLGVGFGARMIDLSNINEYINEYINDYYQYQGYPMEDGIAYRCFLNLDIEIKF